MTKKELIAIRVRQQHLSEHPVKTPVELVTWMGALQAQDYPAAKWALGTRLPGVTEADIEKAIAEKQILRTWPMRGTLHFIPARDALWMLRLCTPRIVSGLAGRNRQLELDDKVFSRTRKILTRALAKEQLSRKDLFGVLEKAGISTSGQRGIHILQWHALEGMICLASHQGKQPAFALMDQWVTNPWLPDREEALLELALRYFKSHGPATLQDFAWWSGLKIKEVKQGLALAGSKLRKITFMEQDYWLDGGVDSKGINVPEVMLLPGFDEYLLGYKDRYLTLDPVHADKVVPGNNGIFKPTLVMGGMIEGTWRRTIKKQEILVEVHPFGGKKQPSTLALKAPLNRYRTFFDDSSGRNS